MDSWAPAQHGGEGEGGRQVGTARQRRHGWLDKREVREGGAEMWDGADVALDL